jgi:hypothetical protein
MFSPLFLQDNSIWTRNKYHIRNQRQKLHQFRYFFEKKIFLRKIDLRGTTAKFSKKLLRGTTGRFFVKKFFFRKNIWTDVAFVADSEYDIYFVFKLSYLVGREVRTWWSLSEKGFEEKLGVIRFVCVHFIRACSCWIELSDDIRMMMFYFLEAPRNLVSITPCILYDLAELGTQIIWSGRIRNRKKFCRQLFNFWKGKKYRINWKFFKKHINR